MPLLLPLLARKARASYPTPLFNLMSTACPHAVVLGALSFAGLQELIISINGLCKWIPVEEQNGEYHMGMKEG